MPTNQVFLVRPFRFHYNEQTSFDNTFQNQINLNDDQITVQAKQEFDQLVTTLRDNGVEVLVFEDTDEYDTPDAIFPNNWISTHQEGIISLYPMYAENRRLEVRDDIVDTLSNDFGLTQVQDWRSFAEKGMFLEGTGSLVLDRDNAIAYCSISERSNEELAEHWANEMGYELFAFRSENREGSPIYHTNVMMNVAQDYVIVCLDAITDEDQRDLMLDFISATNKRIVPISFDQLEHFAGNMLELKNKDDESLIVMSEAAYQSLNELQLQELTNYSKIVKSPIPTIEKVGGGSVRCMIAEIYAAKS